MPKGPARKVIAAAVVTACIAFVGAGIVRDLDQVELERVDWVFFLRASGVLLLAYVVRAGAFSVLVRTMDRSAPLVTSARVFLASQLGRYIPGKVWQVAGAGYFASQVGISGTAALLGTAYYVVIHNLIGGLLGLGVFLSVSDPSESVDAIAAVGIVGVLVVAFASSPWLPRLLQWIGKRLGRDLEVRTIPVWAALLVVASSLIVWSLFGVAVVDVFAGALPGSPTPDFGSAVTTIAAASVAGLAVLFVPSGIGVREAVFVAAYSGTYTLAEGGVVALVLRLLMSGLELVLAVVSLAGGGRWLEPPKQDEPR